MVRFIVNLTGPKIMPTNDILPQIIVNEGHNKELTPYLMFKYAIKTEITRKYYERRLLIKEYLAEQLKNYLRYCISGLTKCKVRHLSVNFPEVYYSSLCFYRYERCTD